MAGNGYIAFGFLSLFPAILVVAYIVLHPRFHKGMPRREAWLCAICMVVVFAFPLVCGFVGRHKRQRDFEMAALRAAQRLEEVAEEAIAWDGGFIVVQLHMAALAGCFMLWRHGEAAAREAAVQKGVGPRRKRPEETSTGRGAGEVGPGFGRARRSMLYQRGKYRGLVQDGINRSEDGLRSARSMSSLDTER
eukprot:TRINITY_DN58786_c0_g1_i1.p3 TRINITY_DN58786_c0_g1~~TRINITY_DN58786_c0_g1_i1.p3  ORF type:complete len:192 (-),score=34.76 TRINITY_DN58786_c0_g1_i1:222-797(-)